MRTLGLSLALLLSATVLAPFTILLAHAATMLASALMLP
jgi:hypothetical protein